MTLKFRGNYHGQREVFYVGFIAGKRSNFCSIIKSYSIIYDKVVPILPSRLRRIWILWASHMPKMILSSPPQAREAYKALNGKGIPLVFIGNTRFDGYDPEQYKIALIDAGLVKEPESESKS